MATQPLSSCRSGQEPLGPTRHSGRDIQPTSCCATFQTPANRPLQAPRLARCPVLAARFRKLMSSMHFLAARLWDSVRRLPPRLPSFVAHSVTKRSEEHTSELQSRPYLVCRLLL